MIKVHINGRVMLDPATFRRIRPNYQFSSIKRTDPDILSDSPSCSSCDDSSSTSATSSDEQSGEDLSESDPVRTPTRKQLEKRYKDFKKHWKKKVIQDPAHPDDPTKTVVCRIYVEDEGGDKQDLKALGKDGDGEEGKEGKEDEKKQSFTDEEYLIASPLALGFSFGEKMWLEFSVSGECSPESYPSLLVSSKASCFVMSRANASNPPSGISDIQWNEGAFESLIIPDDQKTVVRALVESHAFQAENNVDDVIRGKGRGLVAVLHGVCCTPLLSVQSPARPPPLCCS